MESVFHNADIWNEEQNTAKARKYHNSSNSNKQFSMITQ